MSSLAPVLGKHPFFAGLSEDYLELLVGCAMNVRFEAGEELFRTGEPADRFFLVRDGTVALQIHSPERGPVTLQTLGGGSVIGWSWLIAPHTWSFDAQALERVRAVAMDGECLRTKCEENHDLGYELLKRFSGVLAERLEATRRRLLDVYGVAG